MSVLIFLLFVLLGAAYGAWEARGCPVAQTVNGIFYGLILGVVGVSGYLILF